MNYQEFLAIQRTRGLRPIGRSYVDRTIREIARLWDSAIFGTRQGATADNRLEPRLRVILTLVFLVAVSFITTIHMLLVCASIVTIFVLAALVTRRFRLKDFLGGGFGVALAFTLIMALPSTLNLFAHGDGQLIFTLWECDSSRHFGPWTIPARIGITQIGIYAAITLLLRVLTSVSAVLWLTLTTRWLDLLRALRSLGVPALVVQIFSMTMIYLHLLLGREEDVHLARKSRMICKERTIVGQKWVGTRIARAWEDSLRLMEEVHQAMTARGFTGDAKFVRK